MRLTTEFCKGQIVRLSGLPNFPAREGANELVRALARHALSEAHAEGIITEVLDSSRWCPTPADLRQFAVDSMGDFLPAIRPGCKRCDGVGFVSAPYLVTWSRDRMHRTAEELTALQVVNLRGRLTQTQQIVDVARPCDCLEAARLAMPAVEQPKHKRGDGKMRAAGD